MPMFSYVVARFVPDLVRNEPVNVGIMVRDSGTGGVRCRFTDDFPALEKRHPEANIRALKVVLEAFGNADGQTSAGYLESVRRNNIYQLQFTDLRAVESDQISEAVQTLYATYVDQAGSRPQQENRTRLGHMIKEEIRRVGFAAGCVKPRLKIRGKIGHFTFDYGFQNCKTVGLAHSISFANKAEDAYKDAKVLAVSVEDAVAAHGDLECVAVIDPPDDEKARREFYAPAKGHLEDKKCRVVDRSGIRSSLIRIRDKMGA